MLKSILPVVAAGLLMGAPLATARQATQTPEAAPAPAAAVPAPAPASTTQTTPAVGETPAAPAPVAAMAANMKNPVTKLSPDALAKAKQLYAIDCAMCHGDNGNGKTDLATSMSLTLADLTDSKALEGHMDGELFNVIRNGKDKMPGEDKARANDTEVWELILYVRSLAKPQTTTAATQ